jgi:hypothetical protein
MPGQFPSPSLQPRRQLWSELTSLLPCLRASTLTRFRLAHLEEKIFLGTDDNGTSGDEPRE